MTKKFQQRLTRSARSRPQLNIPPISLMWPGAVPPVTSTSGGWEADLGLEELVQALSPNAVHQSFIRKTLTALNTDAEVIAWRQATMADFVRNPHLVEVAQSILPRLANLRQGTALLGKRQRNLLLDTADRLAELELYVNVIQDFHDGLAASTLNSSALIQLFGYLKTTLADKQFQALRHDLPAMRVPLENIRSVTIGINLDVELKPYTAALLAINDFKIEEPLSLLERLIGTGDETHDDRAIAPLHYTPKEPTQRPLSPLFQDLDRLLTQVAQPVANALNRYIKVGSATLASLEPELVFYVGAVQLMKRITDRGINVCTPRIAPLDERIIEMDELVNVSLALKSTGELIASPAAFGEDGRIAIVTGPNNGGKTTYLRSVGLAQVLFQTGLFIPAKAARMSPVDAILTHFPALETRQQGRLAEEASRLHTIFQKVTRHSLVLLNETFSSTASGEAFFLARDILCGLRVVGVRAIFATHLTELAVNLTEIETTVEGESKLFSLIAGVRLTDEGQTTPTFSITRGLPLGRSYAQEIARHHGISLEQILQMRASNGQKPTG